MKIVTACQDGMVRIYETPRPEVPPTEIRASESGVRL